MAASDTPTPNHPNGHIAEELAPWTLSGLRGVCHPALAQFLRDNPPPSLRDSPHCTRMLKRGRSSVFEIVIPAGVQLPFQRLVVKQAREKNTAAFLASPWRRSKAWRSLRAARHLLKHGLDTPVPVAVLEHRRGPFVDESYYITESVDGVKVRHRFAEVADSPEVVRALMQRVADYARRMHASGLVHGDFNLANFLVSDNRLALVDLNRSRIASRLSALARVHDIGRLYWRAYRGEFFDLYAGGDAAIVKLRWFFDAYRGWRIRRGKALEAVRGGGRKTAR